MGERVVYVVDLRSFFDIAERLVCPLLTAQTGLLSGRQGGGLEVRETREGGIATSLHAGVLLVQILKVQEENAVARLTATQLFELTTQDTQRVPKYVPAGFQVTPFLLCRGHLILRIEYRIRDRWFGSLGNGRKGIENEVPIVGE